MQVELTDKDREILECAFEVWDEDMRMYGNISCNDVALLLKKLNIPLPKQLDHIQKGGLPFIAERAMADGVI